MKKIFFFIFTFILLQSAFSQVSITTTSPQPDASAMLDVQSTGKGMLARYMLWFF